MYTDALTNSVAASSPKAATRDQLGRMLRDLRISVTDRCNFRCTYCMPKDVFGADYPYLPKSEILSFEEIVRIVRVFASLGMEKLRLTGGEPLLRRDLPSLIHQLSAVTGLKDMALTTNGAALSALARPLRQAGLNRLTVSVDALDDATFKSMNDADFPVQRVLRGIDAALSAGFDRIKINMVVKKGLNEDQLVPMARHFSGPQYILRFIEYMDVGSTNGWQLKDVVPAAEIIRQLNRELNLEPVTANYDGEVARRFICRDSETEIGIIASVTQPFCRGCTRARLSADGQLYTCLFAHAGHDLKSLLRTPRVSDDDLALAVRTIWQARNDRYSEQRFKISATSLASDKMPRAEMSRLGG